MARFLSYRKNAVIYSTFGGHKKGTRTYRPYSDRLKDSYMYCIPLPHMLGENQSPCQFLSFKTQVQLFIVLLFVNLSQVQGFTKPDKNNAGLIYTKKNGNMISLLKRKKKPMPGVPSMYVQYLHFFRRFPLDFTPTHFHPGYFAPPPPTGAYYVIMIDLVPYHGGGRRKQINAWYLITHMVYL